MNAGQSMRRRILGAGGAGLVLISALAVSARADAATNVALRTALQYQENAVAGRRCADCMQFVPGISSTHRGSCKTIAGDTEILPQACCAAWVSKP